MKKKNGEKERQKTGGEMFTDRNKIHTHTRACTLAYYTVSSSMVKTTLRDWVPSVARFKNETEDATNYSLDLKGRWFRGKGYFWAPAEFYFDRKLMTAKTEGKNITPDITYIKVITKTFGRG